MASRRAAKVAKPSAISAAEYFASESSAAAAPGARRRLRMPGGPRLSRTDIQRVQHARNPGELAKYDHRFLLNLKLSHDLTRHFGISGAADKLFIELGPGPGMLTRALLTRECRGVLGIEIDTKYNPYLENVRNETNGRFQWANANVLDIDEVAMMKTMYPAFAEQLAAAGKAHPTMRDAREAEQARRQEKRDAANRNWVGDDDAVTSWSDKSASDDAESKRLSRHSTLWLADPKIEVVANLPYARAATVAARYAVDCSRRENLYEYGRVPAHIFFQKGLAERVIGTPGTPEFTKLSVLIQNYFRVSIRGTFTEQATYPKPEVYGALVSLEPRREPLVDVDGGVLFNFVQVMMKARARRTTVMQSLKRCVPLEVADFMLREVRVDGDALPTQLSVKNIASLAQLWARFLEASQQNAAEERGPIDWENDDVSGRRTSSRDVGDAFEGDDADAAANGGESGADAEDEDDDDMSQQLDNLHHQNSASGSDRRPRQAAAEEFGRARPRPGQRTRYNANSGPMRHPSPDWASLNTPMDEEANARAGVDFRPPAMQSQ